MGKWTCLTDVLAHLHTRRLRYSARYNQLQKEPFFDHKGSLYRCKISNKKIQFHCTLKTVSLYVKMPLRNFNSFSVFLMNFGRLLLHLLPVIFVKRQGSCSSLFLSFFFSVSQWTSSNFCFPKQAHSFLLSANYNFILLSNVNCWFQFGQSKTISFISVQQDWLALKGVKNQGYIRYMLLSTTHIALQAVNILRNQAML